MHSRLPNVPAFSCRAPEGGRRPTDKLVSCNAGTLGGCEDNVQVASAFLESYATNTTQAATGSPADSRKLLSTAFARSIGGHVHASRRGLSGVAAVRTASSGRGRGPDNLASIVASWYRFFVSASSKRASVALALVLAGCGDNRDMGNTPHWASDARDGGTTDDGDGMPTGTGLDSAAPESEADAPQCVLEGAVYFAAPVMIASAGGSGGRIVASNAENQVAFVTRVNNSLSYVDSLNGGRTFRNRFNVFGLGTDNLRLAVGPRHVHVTSGLFEPATSAMSVTYGAAEIEALHEQAQFELVQFGPWDTNAAFLALSNDGPVALFLENFTLGFSPNEGTYIAVSKTGLAADFSEPRRLSQSPTCVAGLWHSSGALYMAYDIGTSPARFEVRWSMDQGSTFSPPVGLDSLGSFVDCPKLYEQKDGSLLLVTREGYGTSIERRILARRFNLIAQQFDREVTALSTARTLCFDAARTASGRVYVSHTLGETGRPAEGVVLSYSDDDGETWASPTRVPLLDRDTLCPSLAASREELYLTWSRGETVMFSRAGGRAACD
jgi:hypothetical protein